MTLRSLAGLAQVALAKGKTADALDLVERILPHLPQTEFLHHSFDPCQVHLTCWRVLDTSHDPRATVVLEQAHAKTRAIASSIEDEELRRSFLENVTVNREILEAWQRLHPSA